MNKRYESPNVCYEVTALLAGDRYSFVTALYQLCVTKICIRMLSVHTLRPAF